jgi:hypothetical protein
VTRAPLAVTRAFVSPHEAAYETESAYFSRIRGLGRDMLYRSRRCTSHLSYQVAFGCWRRPGPPVPARAIHRRSPVRPGPGCTGMGSPSAAWFNPSWRPKGSGRRFAEGEE